MTQLFLSVVRLDLAAAGWVLLLLLLRRVFADMPKAFYHGVWLMIFAVLVIPARITFKIPTAVREVIFIKESSNASAAAPAVSSAAAAASQGASALQIATVAWLCGFLCLALYSVISTVILRFKLRGVYEIHPRVYKSALIKDAFVLGIFAPKIYLPDGINALQEQYILCHEKAHIRRLDHITKLFAFCVAALHWFDPVVWLLFFTFSHDMEMACDEAVLRKIGIGSREN